MTTLVRTTFTLADGRTLACDYAITITPGVRTLRNGDPGYPDELDVTDPRYSLDGEPVDVDDLPHGLDKIANRLYMAGPREFNYSECYPRECCDEPDEPEYIF